MTIHPTSVSQRPQGPPRSELQAAEVGGEGVQDGAGLGVQVVEDGQRAPAQEGHRGKRQGVLARPRAARYRQPGQAGGEHGRLQAGLHARRDRVDDDLRASGVLRQRREGGEHARVGGGHDDAGPGRRRGGNQLPLLGAGREQERGRVQGRGGLGEPLRGVGLEDHPEARPLGHHRGEREQARVHGVVPHAHVAHVLQPRGEAGDGGGAVRQHPGGKGVGDGEGEGGQHGIAGPQAPRRIRGPCRPRPAPSRLARRRRTAWRRGPTPPPPWTPRGRRGTRRPTRGWRRRLSGRRGVRRQRAPSP